MSEPLSEAEFGRLADRELHALVEALVACSDRLDPDLQSGVLTIHFEDGSERFVVNSHRAARQIWLAADGSAFHFDFDPGRRCWRARSGDEELWATLARMLARRLGAPIRLR